MTRTTPDHPQAVTKALKHLGADISVARKLRRITTTIMADQLQISRPTLRRLEQGDPGVSMGSYAAALHAFGMIERIAALASISSDLVGQRLARRALPQRISSK